MKVVVPSIFQILYKEVLSPFHIFQVFSISLWFSFEYELYAGAILAITVLSIIILVYSIRSGLSETSSYFITWLARDSGLAARPDKDHGQSIKYSAHGIILRVGKIGKNGERR